MRAGGRGPGAEGGGKGGGARLPHIVLVGLPGSGKSTVGALTAAQLGCGFLDFDVEIEHRTERSVSEIFAELGEPAFRHIETDITKELVGRPAMVLAPGGGWMANAENLDLLKPSSRIIHLLVSPRAALSRLGTEIDRRPLLMVGAGLASLERLWRERGPIYRRADAVLDTEPFDPQEVTRSVVSLAAGWGWPVG